MATMTASSETRKSSEAEQPFPVWHASIQSISGCVVRLGGVTYFSPMDDATGIYVITDTSQLIVTGEISEPMASYVRSEIELKLARLPRGAGGLERVA
jgi:hypothetical protein